MTLKVTVDQVMSWKPCSRYDRVKIESLSDKTELSALEIIDIDIPAEDKFWVILRPELFLKMTCMN
jgi:hypothetical protein